MAQINWWDEYISFKALSPCLEPSRIALEVLINLVPFYFKWGQCFIQELISAWITGSEYQRGGGAICSFPQNSALKILMQTSLLPLKDLLEISFVLVAAKRYGIFVPCFSSLSLFLYCLTRKNNNNNRSQSNSNHHKSNYYTSPWPNVHKCGH